MKKLEIGKCIASAGIGLALGAGILGISREELKKELKKDSWKGYETINGLGKAPRIRDLEYQNDTITKERYESGDYFDANAYFTSGGVNTITDNIYAVEGGDKDDYMNKLAVLAHEAEHMHQFGRVNLYYSEMGLWQSYKLYCYQEIGANIAQGLQLRAMYKEAKNDKERKEIIECGKSTNCWLYFSMLEDGGINPFSNKKEDFDEEMECLVNGVAVVWPDDLDRIYHERFMGDINIFSKYRNVKENEDNYKKGVSLMLTIGGIDFSKYLRNGNVEFWYEPDRIFTMTDDVNSNLGKYLKLLKDGDELIKQGVDVQELLPIGGEKFHYLLLNKDKELEKFSLEQRYNLYVNDFFARHIRDGLEEDNYKIDAQDLRSNFEIIAKCEDMLSVSDSIIAEISKENACGLKASDEEYQQKLRKIWTVERCLGDRKFCLLDSLDGNENVLDFSQMVADPKILKDKDKFDGQFIGKVIQNLKSEINKLREITAKKEENVFVDVSNVQHQNKPNYDYYKGQGRRSKVYTTSEVVDLRSDYLAKERKSRIGEGKIEDDYNVYTVEMSKSQNAKVEPEENALSVDKDEKNKKENNNMTAFVLQQTRNGR